MKALSLTLISCEVFTLMKTLSLTLISCEVPVLALMKTLTLISCEVLTLMKTLSPTLISLLSAMMAMAVWNLARTWDTSTWGSKRTVNYSID